MTKSCLTCSLPLPADAPHGLCPACLLRHGLADAGASAAPAEVAAMETSTEAPWPEAAWNGSDRKTLRESTAEQRERVGRLFGRRLPDLQLIGLLGSGGMGEVWLAEHRGLGRRVAVKLLAPDVADDPGFGDRFRREARALAAVNHPNVIKIHDFGEAEGVYFIVMEYHPGTLRERMKGPMAPGEALKVMRPLCEAVAAAHAAGLVHRDLKPENVLLNEDGLKLADFGVARARAASARTESACASADGRLTRAGGVVGTPAYMAPEQWLAPEAVDVRSDVYALGLILAEMLTGKLPCSEYARPSAVADEMRYPDMPLDAPLLWDDPSASWGDARFDRVVARCLQPCRLDRYQSAEALLRAMQFEVEKTYEPPACPSARYWHALFPRYYRWYRTQQTNRPNLRWLTLLILVIGVIWIPVRAFGGVMIFAYGAAGVAVTLSSGCSFACHSILLIGLAAVLFRTLAYRLSDQVWTWSCRAGAAVILGLVLVTDLVGPACRLPTNERLESLLASLFGRASETVAAVAGSALGAVAARRFVHRRAGWPAFALLLGVSLAALSLPALSELNRWMPLVLAVSSVPVVWGVLASPTRWLPAGVAAWLDPRAEPAPLVWPYGAHLNPTGADWIFGLSKSRTWDHDFLSAASRHRARLSIGSDQEYEGSSSPRSEP